MAKDYVFLDPFEEAFYVTGQIGFFLLHDEIAHLNDPNPSDAEDPRFR